MMYLDVEIIKKLIPHRPPILLLDRVTDFDPEKQTLKAELDIELKHCLGHFPGNPVLPGIYIQEAMFQASGVFIALSAKPEISDEERPDGYLANIGKIRYRDKVIPGNVLKLEVKLTNGRSLVSKFKGQAYVGDEIVAEIDEWTVVIKK